jgi:hypothetical protein
MAWNRGNARQAAFLYLLMGLPAPFNLLYLPSKFIDVSDAAATVRNIAADEMIYRLCVLAGLVSSLGFLFLVVTLYELLKDVDRKQARLMVILVAASATIGLVTVVYEIAPLIILRSADSLSAFSGAQLDAMSLGFLRLRGASVSINSALWGLWLLPFGILVIKSGFIPKFVGVALLVSSGAYVVASLTYVLFPEHFQAVSRVTLPLGSGELFMLFWLFIKGVRMPPGAMNLTRIALAALAAFISYFIVGGLFFAVPPMRAEFTKYPEIYRTGDAINSVMAVGMLGIFLAIAVAATIFARMHPGGAGIGAGLRFGVLLALFQLGSFVLHNHMLLNIGWRQSALQGIAYVAEWIVVGIVISLVYRR